MKKTTMNNTKKHNFITRITAIMMTAITLISLGMTSITAKASGFDAKDIYCAGYFRTNEPTYQDKNFRRREIKGFSVNYDNVVLGIQAIFADGTTGAQLGNSSKGIRVGNLPFCAKTGTAERGDGKAETAWFVGYVEDQNYPYAFAVTIEEGGSGADAAAPVADAAVSALIK